VGPESTRPAAETGAAVDPEAIRVAVDAAAGAPWGCFFAVWGAAATLGVEPRARARSVAARLAEPPRGGDERDRALAAAWRVVRDALDGAPG